jgi:hypothetical protein
MKIVEPKGRTKTKLYVRDVPVGTCFRFDEYGFVWLRTAEYIVSLDDQPTVYQLYNQYDKEIYEKYPNSVIHLGDPQ